MRVYYRIIPGLVSLETNQPVINDFLLSEDLTFYPFTKKEKFHYQVHFVHQVPLPKVYASRIGNYLIGEDTITYDRPLLFGVGFRYAYNFINKTFYFNYLYRYHRVNIGDIFTTGRHLFHIIESDLAADNKIILLGAAAAKNAKATIFLSANGGGKTTFMNKALRRGYAYIAENYLILDYEKNSVYGVSPVFNNKKRSSNIELGKRFASGKVIIQTRAKIHRMFLLHPNQNIPAKQAIINYVNTYTAYYKKNNLVRSLLYYFFKNMPIEDNYKRFTTWLKKNTQVVPSVKYPSL
jgi:hypothetical protein